MIEKTIIENLDTDYVSLIITKINDDGVELQRWRKGYANSLDLVGGRVAVDKEVTEPYKTAIFAVWGDMPTITD